MSETQAPPWLSDTTDQSVIDAVIARWRDVAPEDKLAYIGQLNRMGYTMAQARQDMQYPQATPHERRMRLASLWLDRASMMRWYDWDPEIMGR